MDIYERMKPLGIISSSIGEIAIFELSLNDQIKISNTLNNKLESANLPVFISAFITQTCHKKVILDESLSKPTIPSLSPQEISALTFEDLDNIVKLFLERNEYLYKESQTSTRKDSDGRNIVTITYGQTKYPKEKNENYQEYLFRLSILEEKRNFDLMQKSLGPMTEFSKSLQNSITQNLTFGEQLSKTLKSFQSIKIPKVEPLIPRQPEIDYSKLLKPEPQILTIIEVSSKIDTLIDISAEYVQFIIEANKIQTGISEEIKRSSDSASKYSRSNITISWTILIISLLSLIYGISTTVLSNKSNKLVFKEIVNRFDTLIKNASNSQKYYLDNNQKMDNLKSQLDSLKSGNQKLQRELIKFKSNTSKVK